MTKLRFVDLPSSIHWDFTCENWWSLRRIVQLKNSSNQLRSETVISWKWISWKATLNAKTNSSKSWISLFSTSSNYNRKFFHKSSNGRQIFQVLSSSAKSFPSFIFHRLQQKTKKIKNLHFQWSVEDDKSIIKVSSSQIKIS